MRKFLLWFSLLGCVWAQPLHLVFEVQETVTPQKGKPKVSSYPLEVGLGIRHLSTLEHGDKTWMDFDRRRVVEVSGRAAEDHSLYSPIGFLRAESRNRWQLGGVLGQAGIKEGPAFFDPVLTEHTFSVINPDAKALPKMEGMRATYQGKILLDAGLRPLSALPPHTLKLVFSEQPRRVIYVVGLKLCEPGSEPAAPTGLSYPSGQSLTALAHRAARLSDQKEHSRAVQQRAAAALQKGQALTSVLLYLGDSLATGDQSGAALREHREQFQADPACKVLFANLSGQDEAASNKLKALQKNAGPALHVLHIFEAGVDMKYYLEALKTDPHIAGAWKDLGDMHFEAFECDQAWQCWDAARHLAPDFKSLQRVNEMEQMLRKDYPEQF